MTTLKWLASASLALATFPASYAESHCPGNVTSLRLRLVQRSQIIVPVKINHTGPYDFLVDSPSHHRRSGTPFTAVTIQRVATENGRRLPGFASATSIPSILLCHLRHSKSPSALSICDL